ncbi:Gp19/Gp15/Gp42 family protein [Corynebacterium sp. H127]|uniref:Gp19/Gp15/Gp42 family protein n=1 Tax=Corynebacterium sp. H127 TaxID=3133418 RepID=UPI00309C9A50
MAERLVSAQEVLLRLPGSVKPLSGEDAARLEALIDDAEELIRDAFEEAGRDFDIEVLLPRQQRTITRVIREMVAAAVIIGPNAGVRTLKSATGPQSDEITWADPPKIGFSGVLLTDEQRRALGLAVFGDGAPLHNFPPHVRAWEI